MKKLIVFLLVILILSGSFSLWCYIAPEALLCGL